MNADRLTAAKYRKKPVVIEAMQFDGSRSSIEAICQWTNDNLGVDENPWVTYVSVGKTDVIDPLIFTLEGDMSVSPGDFIIRGVHGEFYPCKPDIFKATYEVVS